MEKRCIAFKLNYCDGGKSTDCIGFRGLCSDAVMSYNVNTAKRGWCSHEENYCKKYLNDLDRKIFKDRDDLEKRWQNEDSGFCNESVTLFDNGWYAEAGWYKDPWRPRGIARNGLTSHLCVLTTVLPDIKKSDKKMSDDDARRIFAMFIVKEVFKGDKEKPGRVYADKKWRLEFRPNEVEKMIFKDVYKKTWKQGLFRYFDDAAAVKFLEMAVDAKRGTHEEEDAKNFLNHYKEFAKERAL